MGNVMRVAHVAVLVLVTERGWAVAARASAPLRITNGWTQMVLAVTAIGSSVLSGSLRSPKRVSPVQQ